MKELIAIQNELDVKKTQFNKFGGYYYRSCEDILQAVKPLCVKYNALLTITDKMVLVGDRIYVEATATIRVAENEISSVSYARESEVKKGMSSEQITGSASSFARKYALNALFCIDDNKDADTNEQAEMGTGEDDNLKAAATNYINSDKCKWPEPKKQAVLKGMPKHTEGFLKGIINGTV